MNLKTNHVCANVAFTYVVAAVATQEKKEKAFTKKDGETI
jgi:hypothetical protein